MELVNNFGELVARVGQKRRETCLREKQQALLASAYKGGDFTGPPVEGIVELFWPVVKKSRIPKILSQFCNDCFKSKDRQ